MVAQVDDVARLLAAQQAAFAPERLEHVPVADVGRDDPNAVLFGEAVQPEVRHHRDGDQLDLEVQHQNREDLVAVDDLASRVDREHPVAVPVERNPEVGPRLSNSLLQSPEVGCAAADIDVRPVGVGADRGDARAELLEGLGRDPGVGPVGAVDDDLQAREVGAEPLDDVLEVAVRRDAHVVDRPRLALERRVEQRLDLLFRLVGQLLAVAVEDLDPVVLGRVV